MGSGRRRGSYARFIEKVKHAGISITYPTTVRLSVHSWLAQLPRINMKIGIAGFSGSGKSTVFHWLTGVAPDPSRSQQGQIGKPEIPDERLDWLSSIFKPKK